MNRTSSDLNRFAGRIRRNSSASSWTGSESPVVSPATSSSQLQPAQMRPLPLKVGSDPSLTTPAGCVAWSSNNDSMVSFTVGETDATGDDDDEMTGDDAMDQKGLTRKDIHTINEQRRRDIIKSGYDTLSELVPTCKQSPTGTKLSRATKLQRTIDYIIFLHKQADKKEEEVEQLEREVKALEIMKENYEQISRAQQHAPTQEAPQVPDHVKFLVFQSIADQLFQSFNSSISVTSFDILSSCIISWLEEYCKPQALKELVVGNLQRVNALSSPAPVFSLPVPHHSHPLSSQSAANFSST